MPANFWRRLLLSLLLGVVIYAILIFYSDVQALGTALTRFNGWVILPVLLLTLINLGCRYLKWDYYLRLLRVTTVRRSDSIAIFTANYILILTPGKVGGLLKSYFLKQTTGIPVARTMPIMVAERLTDGLGMVLMTAIALVAFPAAWPAVAVTIAAMLAVVVVAQVRPLALWLIDMAARLPFLRRFAETLHTLYDSAYILLKVKPLLIATLLGTVARAMEGVALFFVLQGLGVSGGGELLAQALFITALSNIIGVLVMMPGGLGGTEGSMAGLIQSFVGLPLASATAATLLARVGSLWVPALLGALALWRKRETFFAPDAAPDAPTEGSTLVHPRLHVSHPSGVDGPSL